MARARKQPREARALGQGFLFESPFIDLELYRLLAAVLASPYLAELARTKESDRPKWEWLRKPEFTEVSRILVSVAAIVRNNLDGAGYYHIELQRPVGLLWHDAENQSVEPDDLTLREACNKILHADHVDPQIKEEAPDIPPSLTPIVDLYGTHRGKMWRAVLDVRQFAVAAATFT